MFIYIVIHVTFFFAILSSFFPFFPLFPSTTQSHAMPLHKALYQKLYQTQKSFLPFPNCPSTPPTHKPPTFSKLPPLPLIAAQVFHICLASSTPHTLKNVADITALGHPRPIT